MTTETHKFKTFKDQIAFDNSLPNDVAYDSLSDPRCNVYETMVKVEEKECPRCKGTGRVKA